MFSFDLMSKQFRVLLRHPSVWFKLLNGLNAAREEINKIENAKLMQSSEKISSKNVYGFIIFLRTNDIVSESIIKYGYWELAQTEIFRRILKERMTVIDVGANLGYYSLMASKLIKTGKVYAFEPEGNNYSLLIESIHANGFTNIIPVQKCVSDKEGYCTLFINQRDRGGNSIVWDWTKEGVKEIVPSITLDTFIEKENISIVDILKIDVEGAEPLVLMGARKILNDNENLKILLEYSPQAWKGFDNLLIHLFQTFNVYKIVNSPFLLKRINFESLPKDEPINLFLAKPKQ